MHKLLLVDDDALILDTFSNHFYDVYQIDSFLKASDALEHLKKNQGFYDLIISDQKMPNINGAEFLTLARKYEPHIPFVAITAYSKHELLTQCVNNAAVSVFISKGIELDEIQTTLDKAVLEYRQTKTHKSSLAAVLKVKQSKILSIRKEAVSKLFEEADIDLWALMNDTCSEKIQFESLDHLYFYTEDREAEFIDKIVKSFKECMINGLPGDQCTSFVNLTSPIVVLSDENAKLHGALFAHALKEIGYA